MHCILSLGSPNHVVTSERSGALATSWRRLEFPDSLKFEEDSGPKLQLARLSDSVILALAVLVAAARGGQFFQEMAPPCVAMGSALLHHGPRRSKSRGLCMGDVVTPRTGTLLPVSSQPAAAAELS